MLNQTRNINNDQETKFIQGRIASTERWTAELCHGFGGYARKAAGLRDKGDELSATILSCSEAENVNKSMSNGLANLSEALSTVADYGEKRVEHIDARVVKELGEYELISKRIKDEVKQIFIVRDKEILRKRQLDRIRERNPRNRQQIIQAETELVQATTDVARTIHNLEEHITAFERQKLHDMKSVLLDFLSTEIGYHAKSIELLSKAYQDIHSVDEEADLEEFKRMLRLTDTIPHEGKLFRSSHSLGSLGSIFSVPKSKSPGIPQGNSRKMRLSKSQEDVAGVELNMKTKANTQTVFYTEASADSESNEIDISESDESKREVRKFNVKRYMD